MLDDFLFHNGVVSTLDYCPAIADSNGAAAFQWMTLLLLAGWVHEASFKGDGDGAHLSNTTGNANNRVTSIGDFSGTNSYVFLSRPAITRGIGAPGNDIYGLRRHASTSWSHYYIPAATDGTKQAKTANGTITTVPTWATMRALRGTLPDTAPSTNQWVSGSTARRYSMAADSKAPYGWYFIQHQASGILNTSAGNGGSWMIFDIVEPGSMDPLDVCPSVLLAQINSATGPFVTTGLSNAQAADNLGGPMTFVRYGLTGSIWTQVPALFYGHDAQAASPSIVIPGGVGLGQYGTLDECPLPFWYGAGGYSAPTTSTVSGDTSQGQPNLIKGRSYMLGWRMGAHPLGFLLKRKTAGDRCVFGDITVPWDGTTQLTYTG